MIYVAAEEAVILYGEMMGIQDADPADFVRDWSLLESALTRPQHAALYEDAGVARQAATLLWRLVRNHPFIDGNKRAAHLITFAFLELNGYEVGATEDEQFDLMLRAAAGDLDVNEIELWIRQRLSQHQTP